jgi:lysophospholipase L1-like esterase
MSWASRITTGPSKCEEKPEGDCQPAQLFPHGKCGHRFRVFLGDRKERLVRPSRAARAPRNREASQRLCAGFWAAALRAAALTAATLLALDCTSRAQSTDPAKTIAELEREIAAHIRLLSDWGGLTRYGSENADLGLPGLGVDRVVFLGDEITEVWGRGKAKFFPGRPFLNRGIAHQTTPQMLVRFRQDVIDLKPKVVVIQAGSSDLAGYAGPATQGTISEHFMTMTELAKTHGIQVVLASVTPVCDCFTKLTVRRPPGKILGLNGWLREYAARSGSIYLDYYSVLADGRTMKKELTVDGLIPNDAGYELMAPLAEQAIAQAMRKK